MFFFNICIGLCKSQAMASQNKKVDLPLSRKPSIKRKLPVIKQTKTSMYRIAKANPLLLLDKDKMNDLGLKQVQLPKAIASFPSLDPNCSKLEPSTNTLTSITDQVEPKPIFKTTNGTNKPLMNAMRFNKNVLKASTSTDSRHQTPMNVERSVSSQQLETTSNRVSLSSIHRDNLKAGQNGKIDTKCAYSKYTNLRRRSSSADRFHKPNFLQELTAHESEIIHSTDDLCNSLLLDANISPIRQVKKVVTFKTPTAYNRRSVTIHTPASMRSSFCATCTSTPGPQCSLNDLQRRLNNWLKIKGKSLGSYHHLKCFVDKDETLKNEHDSDENKENIEAVVDLARNESYENLGIENGEQTIKENTKNLGTVIKEAVKEENRDREAICKAALSDMHKLIQDGYPQNICEIWLDKIWQKYRHLDETPQYWECRASLEQAKGNITSAVECYKTAIVKGAEVQAVDESLDQLLQKFSLLNISTALSDEDEKRTKILLDARSIFKSSIIKFAIQEKTMKH